MRKLKLVKYDDRYFDKWNKFIEESNNGTIFHRLDFLKYHKNRFSANEHHLIWMKGEAIYAVMPMAVFDNPVKSVKSPYGASFGGIVFQKNLNLKYAEELVELLKEYLIDLNVAEVSITETPLIYQSEINEYIEFFLLKNNFKLISADVFNSSRVFSKLEDTQNNFEGRARTTIRKFKPNFKIKLDQPAEDFYSILLEDKKRHNNAKPAHSLEELVWLKEKFPDSIFFDLAENKNSKARAGICYFVCNKKVIMTFYMAQEDKAIGENGINVLLEYGFERAVSKKLRWLDFGGSTIGYEIQNAGIAKFKESFGAKCFLRKKLQFKK